MTTATDERDLALHMVTELRTPHRPLTAWELDFLESVDDRLTHGRSLSERQLERLSSLYKDKAE